ncbi:serine/threonine-protein kinase [Streptomyces collinus]
MAGDKIGPYTVERVLGRGGMGEVYLAQSQGGRRVAVKVVHASLASDPEFRRRFAAEIDAVRRVGGFHTAAIIEADPYGDPPWFATAYIPGPTLAQHLAARGAMSESELRGMGAATAEALVAIHGHGIVHRDLKPSNIILTDDGPRVMDFGIARVLDATRFTHTGLVGTPGFLSPEQYLGQDVTGASDIFALGAVLVAAAGGSAFHGKEAVALAYQAVHKEADLSAVPERIRDTVRRCLAKDPAGRPSARALLNELAESGGDGPQRAGDRQKFTETPASFHRRDTIPAEPPTGLEPLVAADAHRTLTVNSDGITFRQLDEYSFAWAVISDIEQETGRTDWFLKIRFVGHNHVQQYFLTAPDEDTLRDWSDRLTLFVGTFLRLVP